MDITRDGRVVAVSGMPAKAESATAPGKWARATIVMIDPIEQATDTIGSYLAFRCRDAPTDHCSPDGAAGPLRAFRGGAIAVNTDDNRSVGYNERGETNLIMHLGISGSVTEVVEEDAGGLWVEWVDEKSARKQWLRVDLESGARSIIPVTDRLFLKDVVDASRVIALHFDSLDIPTVRVFENAP